MTDLDDAIERRMAARIELLADLAEPLGFDTKDKSTWQADVFADAVTIDGAHHKQWYLEHIAAQLGIDLPNHEPGIAP